MKEKVATTKIILKLLENSYTGLYSKEIAIDVKNMTSHQVCWYIKVYLKDKVKREWVEGKGYRFKLI